ncbi:MAG TPA: sugar transferase [Anaerolineae bacterium]|nr:sugar transferase [Anaerolineae bacterium]
MIEVKTKPITWSRISIETAVPSLLALPRLSYYPAVKRAMDLLLASLLLALLSPLILLIAVAIRLGSPGPALFRQTRVGLNGRHFTMLKFRSMYNGCDQTVHQRLARRFVNGQARQSVYKVVGDVRITPLGRWLRKTSLDELPQLVNVLRGEMSLVGPRPVVPYEVEQYTPYQRQRLYAVPGMTGLPQVSGRSGLTFDKIVRLDLEYIRHRSIGLDIWILLRTIPAVLAARATS